MPRFIDETWVRSDAYHNDFLIKPDAAFEHALKNSDDNGLPQIAVSKAQGKFLSLIARSINAKRILEVGTLGGYVLSPQLGRARSDELMSVIHRYSTLWFAHALPPDGKIITAELQQKHADVRAILQSPPVGVLDVNCLSCRLRARTSSLLVSRIRLRFSWAPAQKHCPSCNPTSPLISSSLTQTNHRTPSITRRQDD